MLPICPGFTWLVLMSESLACVRDLEVMEANGPLSDQQCSRGCSGEMGALSAGLTPSCFLNSPTGQMRLLFYFGGNEPSLTVASSILTRGL